MKRWFLVSLLLMLCSSSEATKITGTQIADTTIKLVNINKEAITYVRDTIVVKYGDFYGSTGKVGKNDTIFVDSTGTAAFIDSIVRVRYTGFDSFFIWQADSVRGAFEIDYPDTVSYSDSTYWAFSLSCLGWGLAYDDGNCVEVSSVDIESVKVLNSYNSDTTGFYPYDKYPSTIIVTASNSRNPNAGHFTCPATRADSILRIALDTLVATVHGKGTLFLKAGTYGVGCSDHPGVFGFVNADSGITIEGEGKGATIIKYMPNITNVWGGYHFATIEPGARHITFKDLTIDCNGSNNPSIYTQGVTSNGSYITFDNVEIINCCGSGMPPEAIMLQDSSNHIEIRNCNTPAATLWFQGAHDVLISDCRDLSFLWLDSCVKMTVSNSDFDAGIYVRTKSDSLTFSKDVVVKGMRIYNTKNLIMNNMFVDKVDLDGDTTVNISNCFIDTFGINKLNDALIIGNTIGIGGLDEYYGAHSFTNSTIEGNIIIGFADFVGDSLTVIGNTFSNYVSFVGTGNIFKTNTIKNDCIYLCGPLIDFEAKCNTIERVASARGGFIRFKEGDNKIFTNILLQENHIRKSDEKSIFVDSGMVITNLNLIDNTIDSCGEVGYWFPGITAIDLFGVTGGLIKDNTISSHNKGIVIHTDCSGLILFDNKLNAGTPLTDWGTGTRKWGVNSDSSIADYDSLHTRFIKKDGNGAVVDTANYAYNVGSAGNSDSLEHLSASQFLRSDVPDTGTYVKFDSINLSNYTLKFGARTRMWAYWGDGISIYQPGIGGQYNVLISADSIHNNNRLYDASIAVYGRATGVGSGADSNFVQVTHNGTDGFIYTGRGDLDLSPASNVGIGTSTPSEKLEINGNCKADTFNGAVIGNVTGNCSGSSGTVQGLDTTALKSRMDTKDNVVLGKIRDTINIMPRNFQATITLPDLIQDSVDAIPCFYVDPDLYPGGITIKNLWIKSNKKSSYSLAFEVWGKCDSVSTRTLKTCATATTVCADSTSLNLTVGADSTIYLNLPDTHISYLEVGGGFTQ